jgi:hypothetical protein
MIFKTMNGTLCVVLCQGEPQYSVASGGISRKKLLDKSLHGPNKNHKF